MLWADADPILPLAGRRALREALGAAPPRYVGDAGHFLQEDAGPELGRLIAEWLSS